MRIIWFLLFLAIIGTAELAKTTKKPGKKNTKKSTKKKTTAKKKPTTKKPKSKTTKKKTTTKKPSTNNNNPLPPLMSSPTPYSLPVPGGPSGGAVPVAVAIDTFGPSALRRDYRSGNKLGHLKQQESKLRMKRNLWMAEKEQILDLERVGLVEKKMSGKFGVEDDNTKKVEQGMKVMKRNRNSTKSEKEKKGGKREKRGIKMMKIMSGGRKDKDGEVEDVDKDGEVEDVDKEDFNKTNTTREKREAPELKSMMDNPSAISTPLLNDTSEELTSFRDIKFDPLLSISYSPGFPMDVPGEKTGEDSLVIPMNPTPSAISLPFSKGAFKKPEIFSYLPMDKSKEMGSLRAIPYAMVNGPSLDFSQFPLPSDKAEETNRISTGSMDETPTNYLEVNAIDGSPENIPFLSIIRSNDRIPPQVFPMAPSFPILTTSVYDGYFESSTWPNHPWPVKRNRRDANERIEPQTKDVVKKNARDKGNDSVKDKLKNNRDRAKKSKRNGKMEDKGQNKAEENRKHLENARKTSSKQKRDVTYEYLYKPSESLELGMKFNGSGSESISYARAGEDIERLRRSADNGKEEKRTRHGKGKEPRKKNRIERSVDNDKEEKRTKHGKGKEPRKKKRIERLRRSVDNDKEEKRTRHGKGKEPRKKNIIERLRRSVDNDKEEKTKRHGKGKEPRKKRIERLRRSVDNDKEEKTKRHGKGKVPRERNNKHQKFDMKKSHKELKDNSTTMSKTSIINREKRDLPEGEITLPTTNLANEESAESGSSESEESEESEEESSEESSESSESQQSAAETDQGKMIRKKRQLPSMDFDSIGSALPNMPSMPSDMPNMPSIPSNMPNMPNMPSIPSNMPNMPSIPSNMPNMPSIPSSSSDSSNNERPKPKPRPKPRPNDRNGRNGRNKGRNGKRRDGDRSAEDDEEEDRKNKNRRDRNRNRNKNKNRNKNRNKNQGSHITHKIVAGSGMNYQDRTKRQVEDHHTIPMRDIVDSKIYGNCPNCLSPVKLDTATLYYKDEMVTDDPPVMPTFPVFPEIGMNGQVTVYIAKGFNDSGKVMRKKRMARMGEDGRKEGNNGGKEGGKEGNNRGKIGGKEGNNREKTGGRKDDRKDRNDKNDRNDRNDRQKNEGGKDDKFGRKNGKNDKETNRKPQNKPGQRRPTRQIKDFYSVSPKSSDTLSVMKAVHPLVSPYTMDRTKRDANNERNKKNNKHNGPDSKREKNGSDNNRKHFGNEKNHRNSENKENKNRNE